MLDVPCRGILPQGRQAVFVKAGALVKAGSMSKLALALLFLVSLIAITLLGLRGTRRLVFLLGLAAVFVLVALLWDGTLSIPQIGATLRRWWYWGDHNAGP